MTERVSITAGLLQQFRDAALGNAGSLEAARLLEEVASHVFTRLTTRRTEELREVLALVEGTSSRLRSLTGKDDPVWLAWYGGALASLAMSLRFAIADENDARRRELVIKYREALGELQSSTELTVSDFGRVAKIKDLAQAARLVERLAREYVIQTTKPGRDRWVRLTGLGEQLLASAAIASQPKVPSTVFRRVADPVSEPASGGTQTRSVGKPIRVPLYAAQERD